MSLTVPAGSHDSGTSDLTAWKGISPDEPEELRVEMTIGCWLGCCLFTSFVKKWSKCQALDIGQQLVAGVRYLDLRVASNRCSRGNDTILCVHGFYGGEIGEYMKHVKQFLDDHRNEVVLLDFNHFYQMDRQHHEQLTICLKSSFGAMLCKYSPPFSFEDLTLNKLCQAGTRVIVFYHGPGADDLPEQCSEFWPSSTIDSFSSWAQTADLETWKRRQRSLAPQRHSADRFYVCQGVLTPDSDLIKKNWFFTLCYCGRKGTLKTECADPINRELQDWIPTDVASGAGGVIYFADFVDQRFVRCVIDQNRYIDEENKAGGTQ